jgi:hypothetical protein
MTLSRGIALVATLMVSGAAVVAQQVGNGPPPGQAAREFSCAAFPADFSEAALVARFGQANVSRAPVQGADNGPQPGAVALDGTPMKLEAVWWDPETRTRLAWIRTREPDSPWRTPGGIAIGMDLAGVERRNGWPFRLAGLLGPEGLGRVRSWGRGRLDALESDGCHLTISFQPTAGERVDPALFRQVALGREFSSGHPAMQAINPQVAALIVRHDSVRRQSVP